LFLVFGTALLSVTSMLLPSSALHLNHYFTKSLEDFEAKRQRGRADSPVPVVYQHIYQPLYSDQVDLSLLSSFVTMMTASKREPQAANFSSRHRGSHLLPAPPAAGKFVVNDSAHHHRVTRIAASQTLTARRRCAVREVATRLLFNHSRFPDRAARPLAAFCARSLEAAAPAATSLACRQLRFSDGFGGGGRAHGEEEERGDGPTDSQLRRKENGRFSSYNFSLIHRHARCCHPEDRQGNNFVLVRSFNAYAKSSLDCEPLCEADPICTHFSHSAKYGNCIICSGCALNNVTHNRAHTATATRYTSWQRVQVES